MADKVRVQLPTKADVSTVDEKVSALNYALFGSINPTGYSGPTVVTSILGEGVADTGGPVSISYAVGDIWNRIRSVNDTLVIASRRLSPSSVTT